MRPTRGDAVDIKEGLLYNSPSGVKFTSCSKRGTSVDEQNVAAKPL